MKGFKSNSDVIESIKNHPVRAFLRIKSDSYIEDINNNADRMVAIVKGLILLLPEMIVFSAKFIAHVLYAPLYPFVRIRKFILFRRFVIAHEEMFVEELNRKTQTFTDFEEGT